MREFVFGTILVASAGAGVYFVPLTGGDRPDYAMSVSEAKQLLAKADLRKGKAPFGTLEVLITAPSQNVVRYEAGGTFASLDCKAELNPVEGGVDVSTSCDRAAADGAAASVAKDLTNQGFAEYVASVLGKRPFDEAKVSAQGAASVLKNMPNMQRDALKMQREMSQQSQEWEAAEAAGGGFDETTGDASAPMDSGPVAEW